MSNQPTPAVTAPAAPPAPVLPQEIRIYSHSSLFYWWPIWAIGFVLAILTAIEGRRMYVFSKNAVPKRDWTVKIIEDGKAKEVLREGVLLDPTTAENRADHLPPNAEDSDISSEKEPDKGRHMTAHKTYGVVFVIALLLVILITNVPLRGLWSVLILVTIILMSIIFALSGMWERIFAALGTLDIRINMGGYICIALGLLIMWVVTFYLFDRQLYITFVPGQFKVKLEIGSGEKTYDTIGMTIEKERSDLFRHWILGLGSGDLVVRTSGADSHEFRIANVLFISRKLRMIEEMQRTHKGGI